MVRGNFILNESKSIIKLKMKLIMFIFICRLTLFLGLNSMEQVHLQYWYPTSTTLYSDHGYQYINNGVTFPSFGDNSVSMTVTNNQLTINFLSDVTYILRDVIDHFNGWTLTDVTGGLDFSDARVLQSSASTSLFRLTSTSTIISVNWVGSSFSSGDVIVIGFMSDVSE